LLGANTTTFDDITAAPGTTYYYWVRALTWTSTDYSYSSFSTPDTGYALATTPPVPTGPAASDGTYTDKVRVCWNDVTGECAYQIYRSTANNSAAAQWLALIPADVTCFDDFNVVPGIIYYYWVRALTCAPGTYYYSNFTPAETGYVQATVPPVPTGVTASDGTYTNKVLVDWNDVTGETGYQIYRSTVNNIVTAAWAGFNGAPNLTSFEDFNVVPGTTYYYWVRALTWASDTYYYSNFSTPSKAGYAATTFQRDTSPSVKAVDQIDLAALVAQEASTSDSGDSELDSLASETGLRELDAVLGVGLEQ
jgi:hypothetical protein